MTSYGKKLNQENLRGLSIEGYFTNKFEQMQKTKETTTEEILSAFNELVREGKITTMSKAKRLELGLADDVEKLTEQAKALIPELTKQKKRIDSIEKLSEKASKDREKKKDNSRKAADKYFEFTRQVSGSYITL